MSGTLPGWDRVGVTIPAWLTSFVGRQDELSQLRQLLDGESRLVTLCGLGGAGKSRLAAELARSVAAAHPDLSGSTVWWVPLTSVSDPSSVPTAVAGALRLAASPAASVDDLLVRRLSEQESTLLVVDNCEQLVAACGVLVSALLSRCPQLRVVTTSRIPLGISGEQVFSVPPMASASASSGSPPAASDAVDLFVRRARLVAPEGSVNPDDPAVAEICHRLGGLPLAIELAASWSRLLSPSSLLARIVQGQNLLESGLADVPDRHQNLTVVLDGTWRSLDIGQQRVAAMLGVFAVSFSHETAEAVTGATLTQLRVLSEASVIQRIPDRPAGSRFQVHELIRAYALLQMEAADPGLIESAEVARFDYFLGLVERTAEVAETADEPLWLDVVRADQDNIDAAMHWALDRGDTDRALRMSAGLFSFWIYTSAAAHVTLLVDRALALPVVGRTPEALRTRARALIVGGYAAMSVPDLSLAQTRFAEGLALWESFGDDVGIARSLRGSGHTYFHAGDWESARAQIERSLAVSQAADDPPGLAWSVHDLAEWHDAAGDLEQAEGGWLDALARFETLGMGFGVYRVHLSLATLAVRRADYPAALERLRSAAKVRTAEHFVYQCAELLRTTASLAAAVRHGRRAAELYGAASTWEETYGITAHDYQMPLFDRGITRSQRQLTKADWDTGYRTGRRWTSDQALRAVDHTLEELAEALSARPAGLTVREVEVLRLLATGMSNDDIARRLVVSPRTVHTHVRAVFMKLGVSTRAAAAHEASVLNLL